MSKIKGYRTYLSVLAVLVLALLQGWFSVETPEWVYGALIACGVAFDRAAVGRLANSVGDMRAMFDDKGGGAQ